MSRSAKALGVTFAVTLLVALGLGRVILGRDVISAVIDGDVLLPAGVLALYLSRAIVVLLVARGVYRFAAWGLGLRTEPERRG
jgi:hypothetical protein